MEVKNIKESSTPLLGMGVEEHTQPRSPFIRDKVMFGVIAACLMTGCTHSEKSVAVKPVAQQKAEVLLVDPDRQHVPSKKIWRTVPKFNVMEQIRAWSQVNDYQLIWAEGTPIYSVMATADFTGDFKTVVSEFLAAATSQHHSTYSVQFFENNVVTVCMAQTCQNQEKPVTQGSNKLLATPGYLAMQDEHMSAERVKKSFKWSVKKDQFLHEVILTWLEGTDYQLVWHGAYLKAGADIAFKDRDPVQAVKRLMASTRTAKQVDVYRTAGNKLIVIRDGGL